MKTTNLYLTNGIKRQELVRCFIFHNRHNVMAFDNETLKFCWFSFFLERGSSNSGQRRPHGFPCPRPASGECDPYRSQAWFNVLLL